MLTFFKIWFGMLHSWQPPFLPSLGLPYTLTSLATDYKNLGLWIVVKIDLQEWFLCVNAVLSYILVFEKILSVRSVTVTCLKCIRWTTQLSSQEGKTGKYVIVRKGTRQSSFLKRKKGLVEQNSLHSCVHGHTILPLSYESYPLLNTVPSVCWVFFLCYFTWHDRTKLPTWCTEYCLFVKYYYSPLHVSSIKYSSSGGHSCT